MSRYEQKLAEAKWEAQKLAKQYIPGLYAILREEESLPPEDCRTRIERDCHGIWAESTIRKYLPEEAKDPNKQNAVRIANEVKKQKKAALLLMTQSTSGERINLTEFNPFNQNEARSSNFQNECISQIVMGNDQNTEQQKSIIKEMPTEYQNRTSVQDNGVLLLPNKIAREIYYLVREAGLTVTTNFKLQHNGFEVTNVI